MDGNGFRPVGDYLNVSRSVKRYFETAELDPEGNWFQQAFEAGGRELARLSREVARRNPEYLRAIFDVFRRGEVLPDCLLLDSEGYVRDVWTPDQKPLRYRERVPDAIANKQLAYLVYSPDVCVFVLDRYLDHVGEVLGETRPFKVFRDEEGAENVVRVGFVQPGVLDRLKFTKVPAGDGKHRKVARELVLGKIVYMEAKDGRYRHPHVRIDGHPAAEGRRIWITQFKDYEVLAAGGKTLSERHGDIRIEVEPNPDTLPNMVVEGFKEYIKQPGGQVPLVMYWASQDRSK